MRPDVEDFLDLSCPRPLEKNLGILGASPLRMDLLGTNNVLLGARIPGERPTLRLRVWHATAPSPYASGVARIVL
jgi:hypothetical protein